MSVSSISNAYASSVVNPYANSYSVRNDNNSSNSESVSTSISAINSTNSDGDTFQLSNLNTTMLSASDVYSKMDADGDGSVSESEFVAARPDDVTEEMAATLYSSFDSDSSGSLSETEFETAMSNALTATDTSDTAVSGLSSSDLFSKMDTDGDGSVSESEFIADRPDDVTEEMAKNLYSSFDSDSSGSLTADEFETAMENAPQAATASDDTNEYAMGAMLQPFSPFAYMNLDTMGIDTDNSSDTGTTSSITASSKA